MDRHSPVPSVPSTPNNSGTKRVPPWEVEGIPQVPYIVESAPPLSSTEKQALPSLWAARSAPVVPQIPRADSFADSFAEAASTRADNDSKMVREPTYSGKSTSTPPQLCEDRNKSPAYGQRNLEPVVQTADHHIVALPGTMSSRSTANQSKAADTKKSCTRKQHKKGLKQRRDAPPLGQRFTTAFKELFRKEPVDESQFERIDERHWSED